GVATVLPGSRRGAVGGVGSDVERRVQVVARVREVRSAPDLRGGDLECGRAADEAIAGDGDRQALPRRYGERRGAERQGGHAGSECAEIFRIQFERAGGAHIDVAVDLALVDVARA